MRHPIHDTNIIFKLLANETRRSILLNLADGDLSLSFLAGLYDITLPGIIKHLDRLESAKLISAYKVGNVTKYHLRSKPILKLIEDITIWYTTSKSA